MAHMYLHLLSGATNANFGPTQRAQNKRNWGLMTSSVPQPDSSGQIMFPFK